MAPRDAPGLRYAILYCKALSNIVSHISPQKEPGVGNGLIKCDLTLETYFTYGNAAAVVTRPVLQRRAGQPIAMRGEIGIRDDGNFRPLVAHNTTHIDMPLHFIEHTPDLAT